jgi:hypothetical protein
MPGFVRLCTVTEYTGCCKCQGLSDYVQWLNIPGVANARFCPIIYSDWIYRLLQIPGFVRLCTVTENTGCCKCQGLSDYVQWLNIPGVANVRVCPTVYSDWIYRVLQMSGFVRLYSDWKQYTGCRKFHRMFQYVEQVKTSSNVEGSLKNQLYFSQRRKLWLFLLLLPISHTRLYGHINAIYITLTCCVNEPDVPREVGRWTHQSRVTHSAWKRVALKLR